MFLFIKGAPTDHQGGAIRRKREGLSFFCYCQPTSTIVRIPIVSVDVPFVFAEPTADFQVATIQDQRTYRVCAEHGIRENELKTKVAVEAKKRKFRERASPSRSSGQHSSSARRRTTAGRRRHLWRRSGAGLPRIRRGRAYDDPGR